MWIRVNNSSQVLLSIELVKCLEGIRVKNSFAFGAPTYESISANDRSPRG